MTEAESQLDQGRHAFQRRAWQESYEALLKARESADFGPADAWNLGLAAFLCGRIEAFIRLAGAAHQAWVDAGNPAAASRCAFWLGLHFAERGDRAQATGWFGRAARLLENEAPGAEQGYLLLPQARGKMMSGDADAACRIAAEAVSIARQHADPDLLTLAIHLQGHALLRLGRVEEGLAHFDEAMVGVTADELSPHVTGLVYCSVIGACREVWSIRRADEWTAALTRWCEGQSDMVAYTGECRVYRAEILRRRGDLQQALQEARTASERFASGSEPNAAGLAAYQQGEVQRQRGEFEAAVEAYRAASRAGYEPQPGLALLRLAQGDGDAAASTLRRALAETKSPLRRVRLLPAFIETMLALDAVDEARHAHDELTGIATTCPSDVLDALVEQWRGAIRLAAGDAAAAVAPLRTALETWQALPAPYEAARIQEILSSAYRILDDADGAAFARDAARETYRELGAEWDVSRLEAPASRSTHGLTPRECEVLALLATGMTNRAIGEDLSIAEKTVARHVANIFQKLGVTSRSAATAYAWEHQLID
jgi:ATP/maltotriose-dependent transcriptional regulator MalT